jgi:hypothetical protein
MPPLDLIIPLSRAILLRKQSANDQKLKGRNRFNAEWISRWILNPNTFMQSGQEVDGHAQLLALQRSSRPFAINSAKFRRDAT